MYQMKGRMQKTMAQANDYPRRDRSETEWYEEVQTFMWIHEDNIVEVPFSFRPIYPRVAIRLQPLQPSHVSKPF